MPLEVLLRDSAYKLDQFKPAHINALQASITMKDGFTKDAEAEARTQEKRRITLISLEKLFDLWDEHYDKLTDRARRRLPLRSIRFLAPGG